MKTFILIFFVGILGVFVGHQAVEKRTVVSDVVLENVEALASAENSLPTYCFGEGRVLCTISGKWVKNIYQGYGFGPDEDTY